MTLIGTDLYIFGGQVSGFFTGCITPPSTLLPASTEKLGTLLLQDPISGNCVSELVLVDSKSWEWKLLQAGPRTEESYVCTYFVAALLALVRVIT